jgi:hypothetical protein
LGDGIDANAGATLWAELDSAKRFRLKWRGLGLKE